MAPTITLLASGTRGDVQPYLALGIGLRQAGFEVRIATHATFANFVASTGLTMAPLAENPSDWFARPGGEYALRFDWRHPLRHLYATLAYWRAVRPALMRLLQSAWQAAQGSDLLIIGLPTLWGAAIARTLHIEYVQCLLQPLTPTRAFPSPLLPFSFSLGGTYNRWTHRFVARMLWLAWRGVLNQWYRQVLHLRPEPVLPPLDDALTLYGFSAHVIPPPDDWSSESITGYWFLPESSNWRPPTTLEKFLKAGTPPVYIGFGSIRVYEQTKTLEIILRALSSTGLRAVLSTSHNFGQASLPANVFPITDVPHSWLFPQMSALVHHGGAGTTAAGLRAGVPTIVVPLAVDQFFWGRRIAELGVGTRPIPQPTLTENRLRDALIQATSDSTMQKHARLLAERIAKEDGVARAVELICEHTGLSPRRVTHSVRTDSPTSKEQSHLSAQKKGRQ